MSSVTSQPSPALSRPLAPATPDLAPATHDLPMHDLPMHDLIGVTPYVAEQAIDPDMLERMARIARNLPGRVVSVAPARPSDRMGRRARAQSNADPSLRAPMLWIDGMAAADVLAGWQRYGVL